MAGYWLLLGVRPLRARAGWRFPDTLVERLPALVALAAYTMVSQAANLKPHRVQSFKSSNDPHFAEKAVDVVGLNMNPPENTMAQPVFTPLSVCSKMLSGAAPPRVPHG